jgi:hypothetical protein
MDVIMATSCHLGQVRSFSQATYKKLAKYQPAVDDSSIARVKPFVMSPFSILAKPAKAFVKRMMGSNASKAKISKARLQLSVTAARGTARLSHVWSMCAALIIGDF